MPAVLPAQADLEEGYARASLDDLYERTAAAKRALGKRVVILGHHYQRDEVIHFSDFRGDSLQLSRIGAAQEAPFIVFCGVHFMAESADILAREGQQVILPDLQAGCSMADMADGDDVEEAFDRLDEMGAETFVPLTYMNSAAIVKAHVGRRGGAVTTSSNAAKVVSWALERADRAFFLPDEHLGRNVGARLSIPLDRMAVWRPFLPDGGLTPEQIRGARLLLWKGCCSVHIKFAPSQVEEMRRIYPGATVIVHPECVYEVAQKADLSGSTDFIIKTVTAAPKGSKWIVGTEDNLVNRLAQENPGKTVVNLSGRACLCSTMNRIDLPHLCWALENLVEGRVVNRIAVPPDVKRDARAALDRMLALA